MGLFRRAPAIAVADVRKTYDVTLHHDSGFQIDIDRISDVTFKFIQNNLGRDQILITDSACINLLKFSVVVIKDINKQKEASVKR